MKRALQTVVAGAALFCTCLPIPSQAVVPGSKITLTFEGITLHNRQNSIPGNYDGLDFDESFMATGKGVYKEDPGFQAVIRGRVACVLANGIGGGASIKPTFGQGPISIKSGHFAQFKAAGPATIFNAYRNGALVGTMSVPLGVANTLVKFDKTFSNIDQFQIIGEVAFDNLAVKFGE